VPFHFGIVRHQFTSPGCAGPPCIIGAAPGPATNPCCGSGIIEFPPFAFGPGVGEAVGVAEIVALGVAVAVAVAVCVGVGVGVAVGVIVAVAVLVGVGEAVAVGVALTVAPPSSGIDIPT
jgi:hypothetical protein